MAIQLDIKSELPTAIKWTNEHTKQLPFSISQAMNASVSGRALPQAKQRNAFKALEGASKQYLDKPKPFTSKGFFATTAKKRNLQILVTPKNKGGDRERYLSGNILGTARAVKGYEVEFASLSKGDIARGTKFVPTRFMKKDRFGNVSQSNLVKIVNSVGNTGRTGSNIFIGKPRGGSRTPGVYRRERNHQLRALFLAVQPGQYPARFPAVRVIETSVKRSFGPYLRQALAKNVANEVRMANRGSF